MPFGMSETSVLVISYIAFLGQIYVISHLFSKKLVARVRYVLNHYPQEQYPKLYPNTFSGAKERIETKLRLFENVNSAIAIIGLVILAGMLAGGFRPNPKGGAEIFVMLYFFLQVIPFLIAAFREYAQYKAMWATFTQPKRAADLKPRHLFDFVSPLAVFIAIACFIAWLVYYLSIKGWTGPWGEEVYISVGMTTAMNVIYAFIIARMIYGKKIDPYQAGKDHLKTIEAMVKILVFSSIGISLFHILTLTADEYALEAFDPALSSLYMQFCAALGFGVMFSITKVEELDFEVYRKDEASGSA